MEKIWHKKKKTRILLIIIANVMVISMMLGVMSIMSYAELFDDLITGKLTQSYEDSYDFDTELMNPCLYLRHNWYSHCRSISDTNSTNLPIDMKDRFHSDH